MGSSTNPPIGGYRFQAGFGLESTGGVAVTPSTFVELTSEAMGHEIDRQDLTGLSGVRSHHSQAVADGNIDGSGSVVFNARTSILGNFLYWAMGGGNNLAPTLAHEAKYFTTEVDKKARVFTYAGSKLNTLELASEPNGPLIVTPNIVPMSIAVGGAGTETTPAYGTTQASPILMHHQAALTLDGNSVAVGPIALTIDNVLDVDHWENSQSRTCIPEGDRLITGSLTLDWNTDIMNTKLVYSKFISGAVAAIVIAYSDGTITWTLTMTNSIYIGAPAQAGDRGPQMIAIPFQAKASVIGQQDELTAVRS